MDKEKFKENINKELSKVTGLLSWLIEQPQLATALIQVDKNKIWALNYIRLKATEMWSKKMQNEIGKKLSKEKIKDINELFKLLRFE